MLSAAHGSIVAIVPSVSHYHSQDDWGQYSYGYNGGPSAKQETRTLDGVTSGGYSYIDANNIVQTVSYVSDPVNGFRVAATNLPQQAPHIVDPAHIVAPLAPAHFIAPAHLAPAHFIAPAHLLTPQFIAPIPLAPVVPVAPVDPVAPVAPVAPIEPESTKEEVELISPAPVKEEGAEIKNIPEETPEVAAARAAHLKAFEIVKAAAEASPDVEEPLSEEPAAEVESEVTSRKRRSVYYAAPLPYYYSPILSSQYEVKDHLGQYTYGYNDGLSAKAESRSFDGTTSGGYSYLDSNGLVQNVNYIADSNGFRVAASNLPVAIKAIDSPALVAPAAVEETEEVAVARAAHLAVHDKLKTEIVPEVPALVAPVPVEDTPEVAAARAAHLLAFEKVKSGNYA